MLRWLRKIALRLGMGRAPEPPQPILVDREGVAYPPTRRVVLKAKAR